jgi:hypothetical protein
MKRYLLVTINIVLMASAIAQDTVSFKAPVIAPSLYWDYGKSLTLWTTFEQKTEAGASLTLIDHIVISGEYGHAKLTPQKAFSNVDYQVEGSYFRFGLGYLAYVDPTNRIGLGIKYGESSFSDKGTVHIHTASEYNNDLVTEFERKNLQARWAELNLTSEKYLLLNKEQTQQAWINRLLAIGVVLRYRWKLSSTILEAVPNYYSIPGYGRASTDNLAALNFYLKLNLR